jgi:tripartite ATP-independent transporter DctM subunit
MLTLTVFALLILLMLIGVPIAICLALTAIALMWWQGGDALLIMLAQRMYSGTTSFPLLAIPFFILAGNLMNTGGMTHRIFAVAQLIVGRLQGGLAHVNVVASMIFAGMSGSAVADAVGLGTIEIPAMEKAGYSKRFAAALTAVSSTIGPIIPPSIPFVIYGAIANVSIGALFLAGVIPGLLMGGALMLAIALLARNGKMPRSAARPPLRQSMRIFLDALPALLTPILVIGGILTGVVTPTEASVLATLYALALGLFFYKELRLADLAEIFWVSGRETVQVLIIIAAAAALGWVLVQQQIPNAIIQGIFGITESPWLILVLVNVILLVLGCFMETIAIMIIVTPIFLPLMAKIGVSPEHFGVIMVLNLMIGLLTPPVGLCLYAIASISRVPMSELFREMIPYIIALLVVLGLVTYVPELSVWLPRAFGFGG